MSVTGEPDGNPVKCGVPVGDLSAGLFCAVGILSALRAPRPDGGGPADRHLPVGGRSGAVDLGDRRAVVDGQRAAAARLRAPAHRAVPGAAHARRVRQRRRQQPEAVGAALRRDRPRRSWSGRSRPTTTGWRGGPNWSRRSRRRWRRGRPTSGSKRSSRRASPRARSTTTRRSSRTRTPRRARWWSRWSTRSGHGLRTRHPGQAQRDARLDPASGAAARPAHG